MMSRLIPIVSAFVSAALCSQSLAECDRSNPSDIIASHNQVTIDPAAFFQKLVDRYRNLNFYRDIVTVTHVTQRDGEETNRVETRITCEVAQGQLKVKTPSSEARQSLKIELPVKPGTPAGEVQKKYDLWLAPHMTLKFAEQPLKELRAGVTEGFTATDAEAVTIDNKPMIHIELRCNPTGVATDSATESCNAKVDLYVNSDSMLIERIQSEQQLPDGGSYSTTLEITPEESAIETQSPSIISENQPPAK